MKRLLIVIFVLMMTISLAGCNSDSLADYKKAADKTEQIIKGQTSGEFSLVTDFNTEGMTPEEIKELNYFKDMNGNFNVVFDDGLEKAILRNYLNFGGLGFDFDLFINDDETFIKLPVIGKYLKIDEIQSAGQVTMEEEFVSEEALNKISMKWLNLMKKEDVFKGKDIVLTTPDGEVKTTVYTIKLSDEQIKSLASDSIDIISKDDKFTKNIEAITSNVQSLEEESLDKLVVNFKESIKNFNVESFNYTAYVDIDGYIVNEVVDLEMKVNDENEASLIHISYKLDISNWDINKEQKFNFPELTEKNTLKLNEMEDMPFIFEDLLKNKETVKE